MYLTFCFNHFHFKPFTEFSSHAFSTSTSIATTTQKTTTTTKTTTTLSSAATSSDSGFSVTVTLMRIKMFVGCRCGVKKTSRIVGGVEVDPVRKNF